MVFNVVMRLAAVFGVSLSLCTAADLKSVVPQDYPRIDSELFRKGVIAADRFRRGLLEKKRSGRMPAQTISRAIVQFRNSARNELIDRVSVNDFKLKEKNLVRAFAGEKQKLEPDEVFASFDGKWYGKWDQMKVDHHWHKTQLFDPPLVIGAFHDVIVRAVQFAWIGDGFGWNVVASPEDEPEAMFILGTVYHVEEGDVSRITKHRPHVGIHAGDDRLIWITSGEIFLEERFDAEDDQPERYAITGFRYSFQGRNLASHGNAFQAVYTRDPNHRPAWHQFWMPVAIE